jgi:hypothetical protein
VVALKRGAGFDVLHANQKGIAPSSGAMSFLAFANRNQRASMSSSQIFEAQYKRVFEAAGCRTQAELAAMFGVRQSSISGAKRRKSIPADWLVALFTKKRVNPEWVLHGEEGKFLTPTDGDTSHTIRIAEVRPPQECSLQELINELVRRAMREPHLAPILHEAAEVWEAARKPEGKI